jgi:hypothetical protein
MLIIHKSMENSSRANNKDETLFVTAPMKQKTEFDVSLPQSDTIKSLFGQINSCISVQST